MSTTPSVQETAEERAKKEHQATQDRLAKANAVTKVLSPLMYSFEEIGDPAEIKRRQDEINAANAAMMHGGTGGGIAISPDIITNLESENGTFKVFAGEETDKDRKEIPKFLLYVKNGVVSSSVPGHAFKQENADMMIAKALKNGKDLILNVGNSNTDWSKANFKKSLKNLDKMMLAANKAGQPYVLGANARNMFEFISSQGGDGAKLYTKYLDAEKVAFENSVARNLVMATTRDGGMVDAKKQLLEHQKNRDTTPINTKTAVPGLTSDEKINAITQRLEELAKSANINESAAKEVKTSVEGAENLLKAFLATDSNSPTGRVKGAALFTNMSSPADPFNEASVIAEESIQKAEAALSNIDDKLSKTSVLASTQAMINDENIFIKSEAGNCQQAIKDLEDTEVAKLGAGAAPKDLDDGMKKEIARLRQQAAKLDGRVKAMDKDAKDVGAKVLAMPKELQKAQDELDKNKDTFKNKEGRSPSPRK